MIEKKIEVLLICGRKDEDCLPLSRLFVSNARELGLNCKEVFIDDLGHAYPDHLESIIEGFLWTKI